MKFETVGEFVVLEKYAGCITGKKLYPILKESKSKSIDTKDAFDKMIKKKGIMLDPIIRKAGLDHTTKPIRKENGKLILDKDNIHRPKLPTFTTAAERTQALTNRDETLTGMSEVDVRRAREFRAREDAEVSIKNMDGRSPYIPEEERKQPRGTV